jgi:hypothetical protein
MSRKEHTKTNGRARAGLANLAIGAALLFSACGTSQALSEGSQSGAGAVLRDPENPYWTGASTSLPAVDSADRSSVIRDSDNPLWTGASAGQRNIA